MGSPARPFEVAVVLGTRSEAVALAPVVRAMRRSNRFCPLVVSTGQQRDILDQVLRPLGVRPDVDLALPGADPGPSARRLPPEAVERLGELLVAHQPDAVLVHGDSASAFGAALAAFSEGFRVGHLGAGHRSGAVRPGAEDANQRLIDPLTRWHLAPTAAAAGNLVAEGVDPARITVTGPTGLDALRWAASLDRGRTVFGTPAAGERVLACLRLLDDDRERWQAVADVLLRLGEEGAEVVLPRHPDGVSRALRDRLRGSSVRVVPPLEYLDYVATLRTATLVVTDSAAVQDEASSLGVPLMVVGDAPGALRLRAGGGEVPGELDEGPAAGRVLEVLTRPLPPGTTTASPGAVRRAGHAAPARSAAAV